MGSCLGVFDWCYSRSWWLGVVWMLEIFLISVVVQGLVVVLDVVGVALLLVGVMVVE